MIRLSGTVTFLDGTTKTVEAGQWAYGQLDLWALKRGHKPIKGLTFLDQMPVVAMRVIAWAALTRGANPAVSFESWDATVDEVEFAEPETVDPTQTTTPEEQSQE